MCALDRANRVFTSEIHIYLLLRANFRKAVPLLVHLVQEAVAAADVAAAPVSAHDDDDNVLDAQRRDHVIHSDTVPIRMREGERRVFWIWRAPKKQDWDYQIRSLEGPLIKPTIKSEAIFQGKKSNLQIAATTR